MRNTWGEITIKQRKAYFSALILVIGTGFFFSANTYAVNQEVDRTYLGRQIDEVFFGAENGVSFLQHNGVVTGDIQSNTFGLKMSAHEVRWQFTALKRGLHVLLLDCKIYSDKRLATPFYLNTEGLWVKLPRCVSGRPGIKIICGIT